MPCEEGVGEKSLYDDKGPAGPDEADRLQGFVKIGMILGGTYSHPTLFGCPVTLHHRHLLTPLAESGSACWTTKDKVR
jgi:hypothetical protein